MAKAKRADNLIALKCAVCGRRNYYTSRNKKKVERKIEFTKYCAWDRKPTIHKETRLTGK